MSETIIDQTLIPRRTFWGAAIQTATYLNIEPTYLLGSTLNEKYNKFANQAVPSGSIPELGYFSVGRGSTYTTVLPDGSTEPKNFIHEPHDADLFYPVPFVLRTTDNDLTSSQRAKFGMRVKTQVDGTEYYAYYLKRLNKSETVIDVEKVIPGDPTDTVVPVEGDLDYLNPTPIEPTSGTVRVDGAYGRVKSIVTSELDAWDIDELLNAKQILTGTNQLEITEIGLFSGIDQMVSDAELGINYNEVMRAQLNNVSPSRILINQSVGVGLTINHDLGINDPSVFNFVNT